MAESQRKNAESQRKLPDREKVIRGLECCVRTIEDCECADNCPYETQCWDGTMYLNLMRDALALLREQESEYTPDGPDFVDGRAFIRWKCTSCQYFVCTEKGTPDMKYCPACGRRIKYDA